MPSKPEVIYTLAIEPEDQPVRGNFASGDPAQDKADEGMILARLDRGEIEAWCCVVVNASITVGGQTFSGRAAMGGCCYDTEKDLRDSVLDSDEYGMKGEALEDLRVTLRAARDRGFVADKALESIS